MSDPATEPANARAAPSPRWRRMRRLVLELAVVALVFAAVRAYRLRDVVTGPFPERDVTTVTGERLHLGGAQAESVVVHVWATWCPTCRAMEGAVESAAQHLRVVSIAAQSGSDREVRAYATEHGVTVPIVNDPSGELTRTLGVHAFPTTLFLDGDGRVVAREVGYTTALGLRARALLGHVW